MSATETKSGERSLQTATTTYKKSDLTIPDHLSLFIFLNLSYFIILFNFSTIHLDSEITSFT